MNRAPWQVLLLAALAACAEVGRPVGPSHLVVTPRSLSLEPLDTAQLTVSVLDADSALLSDVAVIYGSSDARVARVSPTGLVTGGMVLEPATIVVAAGGLSTDVGARVGVEGGTLLVTPDSIVLPPGRSVQLAVSVRTSAGALVTGLPTAFSSRDASVAIVSSTGLATLVGQLGDTTTIRVSVGALSENVPVRVELDGGTLEVVPQEVALMLGMSAWLSVTVRDRDGVPVTAFVPSFASSDVSVATVSPYGEVTAVGVGSASVLVTVGSFEAVVAVTVIEHADTDRIVVSGCAWGAAVSRDSVWYVTQPGMASLAGGKLDTAAFLDTIPVGLIPTQVAFAPDGQTAYVTNQLSQSVGVVSVSARTQVATIAVPGDPFVVAVSPDGSRVYATLNNDLVAVLDPVSRTTLMAVPVGDAPNGLAFNADGSRLYVSAFFGGVVSEIDPTTNTVLRTLTIGGKPQGIAVAPDGSELYVANELGALQVVSLATGLVVDSVPAVSGGFDLAQRTDGGALLVTVPSSGVVFEVDPSSRTVSETILTGGEPRRVAYGPSGTVAIVANCSGWVDILR